MANEISFPYNKDSTIYARIFNSTGQVWNTSGTPAFENWSDDNVTDYDIALTDKTSGEYLGDFPATIPADLYKVHIYNQAGANPAITDSVIGVGQITWNGTVEIRAIDVLVGDAWIDKTATPWQLVIDDKDGSELFRKNLKDVDGNDLTSIVTVVGQQKEP